MNSNNAVAVQFQEMVRQVDIRIMAVYALSDFKREMRELRNSKWEGEDNTTVEGEIQYRYTYIAGYIHQVLYGRGMKQPRAVQQDLKDDSIFMIKHVLEWYKDSGEYRTVAYFVELLELARAYIIDYCDAILDR